MRDTFSAIKLVDTFLNGSDKSNSLGDILKRTVLREGFDSLKSDLFP